MNRTIITDNYKNITEARKAIRVKAFRRMVVIIAKRAKVSETTVTNLLKVDGPITSNTVMIVGMAIEEIQKIETRDFPDMPNVSRKTRSMFHLTSYYLRCKTLCVKTMTFSMDLKESSKDEFFYGDHRKRLEARSKYWMSVSTKLNKKAKQAQKELELKGFKKI